MSVNFFYKYLFYTSRDLLHAAKSFYFGESRATDFCLPYKICRSRPGLNLRTMVPTSSTITTRPPRATLSQLLQGFSYCGPRRPGGSATALRGTCYPVLSNYVKYNCVRFQVLTAASMMFRIVFWDVLPCKAPKLAAANDHLGVFDWAHSLSSMALQPIFEPCPPLYSGFLIMGVAVSESLRYPELWMCNTHIIQRKI
jgi:hypothetical protein